jgi:hypothetical protein
MNSRAYATEYADMTEPNDALYYARRGDAWNCFRAALSERHTGVRPSGRSE